MKDKINPHGWVTADYMRNPVVLWSHNAQEPPVGRMVRIFVSGDRLMGDVQFPADGVYEFADQIYRLITSGYINAGSVGFIPLEWKFADSKDRQMGVDFLKQELIEFSICPVPANANALIEARSWGGRKADPEFRELIGQLGRLIRAAQLRKELPPPLYTRAECREIVEALRREV
jgi:HK97 family phage prohead protease